MLVAHDNVHHDEQKITILLCSERNSLDGKIPSEVGYLTGLAELTFSECLVFVWLAVSFL